MSPMTMYRGARRTRTTTTVGATVVAATAVVVALTGCSAESDTVESGQAPTTAAAPAPVALVGKVNDHGSSDVSGAGARGTVEMELDDDYFGPTYVKAAPGEVVSVELRNEGSKVHTFTLDGGVVDVRVEPGGTAGVDVSVPDSGTLHYFCQIHSGAGMQGAFYVDGASASPSVTTAPTTTASSSPDRAGY